MTIVAVRSGLDCLSNVQGIRMYSFEEDLR
jgi:hypothetical protein